MSAVWVIRADANSALEEQKFALRKNCAVIGWHEIGDISLYKSRKAAMDAVREFRKGKLSPYLAQPWHFANSVKEGHWVILPLKNEHGKRSYYSAVGRVNGRGYRFDNRAQLNGCKHQLSVQWKNRAFSDKDMPPDLLSNIRARARGTVTNVGDNELGKQLACKIDERSSASDERGRNLKHLIADAFPDRALERLVAGILKAMDYDTGELKKGSDGGVDVFAFRRDWLGLEDAVCVQVKNSQGPKGAPDIQHLVGAMSEPIKRKGIKGPFHKGLFVSMSGFAKRDELKRRFPHIRLWDGDDVLRLVGEHYRNLASSEKLSPPQLKVLKSARSVQ